MLPVIALLGRPNVGKSTLFNQLTRTRDALVADTPGLTRDRKYGVGRLGPRPYIVIDTGGLGEEHDPLGQLMSGQSLKALEEADAAVFVVDGRGGLSANDQMLAEAFRRQGKPIFLAVNKTEGLPPHEAAAEFHALGLGQPHPISAIRGRGVEALIASVLESCPQAGGAEAPEPDDGVRVAIIGRPNVGKSTLINRWLGEERLVAFDQPGTTRDSVMVPFMRDGHRYALVDTAGVRRKSRVGEGIEKLSIVKTLQAIEDANVVVALVDAREGITDQDASLMGLAVDRGRALVVAVNKWDGLPPDQRDLVRRQVDLKLPFLRFARLHYVSALHGTGIGDLLASVDKAWEAAMRELSTPELTRVMREAVDSHQPPLVHGRRIKLRYAHQGGRNPPVIVIHGNQTEHLPKAYVRYLENVFREAFHLQGTPVRLEFRSSVNPFAGRRNKLTPAQQRKRERLKRHVKKGK
jgi:GTP-binding protein